MATLAVLTSIGIIVGSFIGAFLFYYIVSPQSSREKRKMIEQITSILINFVIFIWIGKICVHIHLFIRDPLAVLAYPSNTASFYVACLFIVIYLIYKVKRHHFHIWSLIYTFVPIFLVASFIYHFAQIVWMDHTFAWVEFVLLTFLLLGYLLVYRHVTKTLQTFILLFTWNIGKIVIAFLLPYTTIFGYTVSITFLFILLIFNIFLFIYDQRSVLT